MPEPITPAPVAIAPDSTVPIAIGVGVGLFGLVVGGLALMAKNSRAKSIDKNDIANIFPSRRQDGVVLTLESGERLELSYRAVKTIGRSAREWRKRPVLDVP